MSVRDIDNASVGRCNVCLSFFGWSRCVGVVFCGTMYDSSVLCKGGLGTGNSKFVTLCVGGQGMNYSDTERYQVIEYVKTR